MSTKKLCLLFPLLLVAGAVISSCSSDSGGNETPVIPTTGEDVTPPSVPGNLTGTARSSSEIGLVWDASSDEGGIREYIILRDGTRIGTAAPSSLASSAPRPRIRTFNTGSSAAHERVLPAERAAEESFTDSGLASNQRYCYEISAVDRNGNESRSSGVACATTLPPPANANCGSALPLQLSNFSLPARLSADTAHNSSATFNGNFSAIANPVVLSSTPLGNGQTILSAVTNRSPEVDENCNMNFLVSVDELSGAVSLSIELIDYDRNLSLVDNKARNSMSNKVTRDVTIE